ncbi:membrane protein [Cutibacterium acnes JCM 18918]|nr:membrane protein [Cutibacterium acnes JCM 18918]
MTPPIPSGWRVVLGAVPMMTAVLVSVSSRRIWLERAGIGLTGADVTGGLMTATALMLIVTVAFFVCGEDNWSSRHRCPASSRRDRDRGHRGYPSHCHSASMGCSGRRCRSSSGSCQRMALGMPRRWGIDDTERNWASSVSRPLA